MFLYRHKVQFYETDLMGVVHHSNYLRFYEAARVAWAHEQGLISYQKPESASHFAVYHTEVKHLKPAFFGEDLEVEVRARREGVKIFFQYRMSTLRQGQRELVSTAQTTHVPLDKDLKVKKLPTEYLEKLEKAPWTETWL